MIKCYLKNITLIVYYIMYFSIFVPYYIEPCIIYYYCTYFVLCARCTGLNYSLFVNKIVQTNIICFARSVWCFALTKICTNIALCRYANLYRRHIKVQYNDRVRLTGRPIITV